MIDYVTDAGCFDVCCSDVSLQHSQSASPADIKVYNENLGLSVERNRQLQIPEHVAADHARHMYVTRAPEPPPAYDGAVPSRSRVRNHHAGAASENGSAAAKSPGDEKRIADHRATDRSVSARVYDGDQRISASPNVQYTSDISLASSNVTTYEDNGRQKVCSSTDPFDIIESV